MKNYELDARTRNTILLFTRHRLSFINHFKRELIFRDKPTYKLKAICYVILNINNTTNYT